MTVLGVSISMTVIWLIIAVACLIIEGITVGLTTIWFAAGAFVALICSLFDLGLGIQVIIFLAVSLFLLIFTRKIFVEKLKAGSQKTNVNAVIGEKCVVISPIKPYQVGQVKLDGQVWSAVGKKDDMEIDKGQLVKVCSVEGVKLVVIPEN